MSNKYTWWWNAKDIDAKGEEVLSFCYSQGVTDIFLQYSTAISANVYSDFISNATYLGIRVHACMGDRSWYDPINYDIIDFRLKSVAEFNASRKAYSKFSGVHFDIEPHTLPEWQTDQLNTVKKWETTVEMYSNDCFSMGLELSASLPFSTCKTICSDNTNHLSSFMIKNHNKIAVMSYRDKAEGNDSILYHSKPFLEHAVELGRANSIIIGVETKDTAEGDKITFAQEGRKAMNEQLYIVDWQAGDYRSYAGHAIHAVNYWMELPL